jgi:hypothetical protein
LNKPRKARRQSFSGGQLRPWAYPGISNEHPCLIMAKEAKITFYNNKQESVAAAADTARNNIPIYKSASQQVQGAAKKELVKPNGQGDSRWHYFQRQDKRRQG